MPPKRKLNSLDDDEEPTPGNRVLPVANLPNDFDGEPEDGVQVVLRGAVRARRVLDEVDERAEAALQEVERDDDEAEELRAR